MLLTENDQKMFSKWYGKTNLINEDEFWNDVLSVYGETNLAMPYALTFRSMRIYHDYLKCTGGDCGHCCDRDWYTPVTQYDLERIRRNNPEAYEIAELHLEEFKGQPAIKGPCPFLIDKKCSIYDYRPDTCAFFPVQADIHEKVKLNGKDGEIMFVRVKCKPSVDAIREMFRELLEKDSNLLLLPNLNIIPKSEV
jgi:Fe-S-cluster containining protein